MTQQDAKKALARLFLSFCQTGDDEEQRGKMLAYWNVMQGVTPRYVIDACDYAAKGKLGDPKFMPTAGELYQCAQALEHRASRQDVRRYLSEPEVRNDPQTSARICAGFKKLLTDLHVGVTIDPEKATKAVFHPELPDYRDTPLSVSTSLQTKLAEIAAEDESCR